jgi:CubicO group peptidase (beta-lactamase class C family)
MKKVILILVIFLSGFSLTAQEKAFPIFIKDSLDAYIDKGMRDWQIPGLSVAIVKDDQVVYLKGFGVTSINSNEPVNENTLFMIGSNTKAFTATTLSILQESTDFKLSDKVKKWMPEFRLKDSLATKEVNIIDLLSHRIGFETFQGDFTYWRSNLTRAQVIQKMGLIDAPYGFRSKWGYCNAAFVTAGEIIPRIIGRSWEETVKDSILVPLHMKRTLMLAQELKKASNAASPHTIVDNKLIEIPIPDINNLAPAGSMSSSAKDMTNWLLAQINSGRINDEQVLSVESLQAIRRPSSILGVDSRDSQDTHFYLYGMGLMINDCDGKLVYSHGGAVDGFLSQVMFVPEENLGIVVLTNTDKNNFYDDLTYEIRDAFLSLPYKGYSYTKLKKFKADELNKNNKIDSLKHIVKLNNSSSLPIDAYTGDYENGVYGKINVKLEENKLNIYFSNHPDLIGKLEHIQNDNYLCTYTMPIMGTVEIPFKIENNKVIGLTLSVDDFIEFTPYEFKKTN